MTMDTNTAGNSAVAGQPSSASNTDPEFWMKRLNEMKKGADIQTSNHVEVERTAMHPAPTNVGNTYLLKQTVDSNRVAAQSKDSFKEQVLGGWESVVEVPFIHSPSIFLQLSTMSDHGDRLELIQKKLAQLQMAKLNRN